MMKQSDGERGHDPVPRKSGWRMSPVILVALASIVIVAGTSCGVMPGVLRESSVSLSVQEGASARTFWPAGESTFYTIDRFRIRAEGPDGRLVDQMIGGAPNGVTVNGFVEGAWTVELTAFGESGGTWYVLAVGSASPELAPGPNSLSITLAQPEGLAPGTLYVGIGWNSPLSGHHLDLRIEESDGTTAFSRTYINGTDAELGSNGFSTPGMVFPPGSYTVIITLYNASDVKRWGMAESVYIASGANTSVQYSNLPITLSIAAPRDGGELTVPDWRRR